MALGQLKEKEGELVRARNGRFNDHFRYLLTDLLNDLEYLGKKIESLERHIEAELAEHQEVLERLCTIPGVSRVTAWTIVAEIGLDTSVFPDAGHLASWAGLCPGNNESAGKRLGGRTRKGNRYLRRILVQASWAIAHTRDDNFLNAVFFRTARRRGLKKAALAVAHRMVSIAYYILRDGTVYRERGGDYYDRLHPERTVKRLVARLEKLGMQVALTPKQETRHNHPPRCGEPAKPRPSEPRPARKRGRPGATPPEGCPGLPQVRPVGRALHPRQAAFSEAPARRFQPRINRLGRGCFSKEGTALIGVSKNGG